MPIDPALVESINKSLDAKRRDLNNQQYEIKQIMDNLLKVSDRLIRNDVIDGAVIPVYGKPLDLDLGINVEMDDAKRQMIYDANITRAKEILGL